MLEDSGFVLVLHFVRQLDELVQLRIFLSDL